MLLLHHAFMQLHTHAQCTHQNKNKTLFKEHMHLLESLKVAHWRQLYTAQGGDHMHFLALSHAETFKGLMFALLGLWKSKVSPEVQCTDKACLGAPLMDAWSKLFPVPTLLTFIFVSCPARQRGAVKGKFCPTWRWNEWGWSCAALVRHRLPFCKQRSTDAWVPPTAQLVGYKSNSQRASYTPAQIYTTVRRAQNAASSTCGCCCSLLSGATGSIVTGISNLPNNRTLRRKFYTQYMYYIIHDGMYTQRMLATFMSCSVQSGYHACTYKYHATQRNFDGAELQVTEVQAIVHISCSSGEC